MERLLFGFAFALLGDWVYSLVNGEKRHPHAPAADPAADPPEEKGE